MLARNGIPNVLTTGIVITTALTLIQLVRCETQTSSYEQIGCINNSARCYVVYSWSANNYQTASEICRSQHNGNLANINNNSHQELLLGLFSNYSDLLPYDYWIGAQLELLDNWTWTDGTIYALNSIPGYSDPALRGYASIVMSNDMPTTMHLTTIPLNQPDARARPQYALCRRDKHRNQYFNVTASRWFDGRNSCRREGGDLATLAVLASNQRFNGTIQKNKSYFVGLANVRLVWIQSSKTGNVDRRIATYTNFNDRSPFDENELCVTLYPKSGEWNVANCNATKPFICQFKGDNRTTPRTTQLESSSTSTFVSTSRTSPSTVSSTTTTTTTSTTRPTITTSRPTTTTTTTTTTTSLPTTSSTRIPTNKSTTDSDSPMSDLTQAPDHQSAAVTVAVIALSLILFLLIVVGLLLLCCLRRKRLKGQSEEAANHYQQQQQQPMTPVGQNSTNSPTAADEIQYATIIHAGEGLQPVSSNRKNGERGGKPVKEEPQYSEVITQRRGPPPIKSKPQIGSDNRTSSSSTSASKTASQGQVQPNVNNKDTATDNNTVYACIVPTSCPVDTSTNNDQSVIYAGLV